MDLPMQRKTRLFTPYNTAEWVLKQGGFLSTPYEGEEEEVVVWYCSSSGGGSVKSSGVVVVVVVIVMMS